MRRPLLFSAGLHAAVLIATIVALPSPKELAPVQTRVLPVELLTVADVTNLKRQAKKHVEQPKPVEKPSPKPEPEKPKPAPQPEPEKAEPAPTPPEQEVKPEPIPDKKAEKKPEEKKPQPKPESKKPVVEKKTAKKKPAFDPSKIAALLNKIPDAATQPDEAKETKEKADASETDNPDEPMTGSEIDVIRQKISQCWNMGDLAGSPDADKLYAKISFSLNQDGSISGRPVIEESGGGSISRLFAERAVQAVLKCAPYDFLPADKFNSWRDIELNFSLAGAL